MNFSPKRPRTTSARKEKRDEMRRIKNEKRLAAVAAESVPHELHEGGVELGSSKTVGECVVSIVKKDVEPVAQGFEPEKVEGVLPSVPSVEIVDSGS